MKRVDDAGGAGVEVGRQAAWAGKNDLLRSPSLSRSRSQSRYVRKVGEMKSAGAG